VNAATRIRGCAVMTVPVPPVDLPADRLGNLLLALGRAREHLAVDIAFAEAGGNWDAAYPARRRMHSITGTYARIVGMFEYSWRMTFPDSAR
jgi:hypothetical protein